LGGKNGKKSRRGSGLQGGRWGREGHVRKEISEQWWGTRLNGAYIKRKSKFVLGRNRDGILEMVRGIN